MGWLYLEFRQYRILLWAVPLGIMALVVVLLLPGKLGSPVLSSSSLHECITSWDHNLNHVLRRPWGSGIGASGAAVAKTASLTGSHTHTFQPDNYYFKEIYELGIPGLVLFVWLLVAAFWDADRKENRIRGPDSGVVLWRRRLRPGCGRRVPVVSTYFEIYPMDLMFWLLIAVVATLCPTSPSTA